MYPRGATAAEVLGGSEATAVYRSEGVKPGYSRLFISSNLQICLNLPKLIKFVAQIKRHVLAVRVVVASRILCRCRLFWPSHPRLVVLVSHV